MQDTWKEKVVAVFRPYPLKRVLLLFSWSLFFKRGGFSPFLIHLFHGVGFCHSFWNEKLFIVTMRYSILATIKVKIRIEI